jgi:hypothetical protein
MEKQLKNQPPNQYEAFRKDECGHGGPDWKPTS